MDAMGEVTHGYNAANIDHLKNQIDNHYNNFKNTSETALEDVKASINRCWFGEDCNKFINILDEKVTQQNENLKTFFTNVEEILEKLKQEWIKFQSDVSSSITTQ